MQSSGRHTLDMVSPGLTQPIHLLISSGEYELKSVYGLSLSSSYTGALFWVA